MKVKGALLDIISRSDRSLMNEILRKVKFEVLDPLIHAPYEIRIPVLIDILIDYNKFRRLSQKYNEKRKDEFFTHWNLLIPYFSSIDELVPIFCEYSSIAVETLSITYKCPTKYGYFFSLLKHYNLKDIDIFLYLAVTASSYEAYYDEAIVMSMSERPSIFLNLFFNLIAADVENIRRIRLFHLLDHFENNHEDSIIFNITGIANWFIFTNQLMRIIEISLLRIIFVTGFDENCHYDRKNSVIITTFFLKLKDSLSESMMQYM
ncbi:hypothetical protein U3516DRAFT_764313 [Neocallimastix sp. 'constans']